MSSSLSTYFAYFTTRALLNQTTEHCNTRKHYGLHLSQVLPDEEPAGEDVGQAELPGEHALHDRRLVDISECPDVEMESVIVKLYAAE